MKKKKRIKKDKVAIGNLIGFEGQEAYNLLRTNLMLSFANNKKCKLIGITSAMHGDGKSVTAINTSYTFAMAGYKVLLIEGDLRLPTISYNLRISQSPGLSNYLVGQCTKNDIVKINVMTENLNIISAGDIPPNPSELLGSSGMSEFLEELSGGYDYIIVDLPPVSAVSDAIVLSRSLDGIVIVIRHRYTDKSILSKMMRQFKYAEVKILGYVLNDFDNEPSKYSKKYKKYYSRNKNYYKVENDDMKRAK